MKEINENSTYAELAEAIAAVTAAAEDSIFEITGHGHCYNCCGETPRYSDGTCCYCGGE